MYATEENACLSQPNEFMSKDSSDSGVISKMPDGFVRAFFFCFVVHPVPGVTCISGFTKTLKTTVLIVN